MIGVCLIGVCLIGVCLIGVCLIGVCLIGVCLGSVPPLVANTLLQAWYDEDQFYDYATGGNKAGSAGEATGHFTQVIQPIIDLSVPGKISSGEVKVDFSGRYLPLR